MFDLSKVLLFLLSKKWLSEFFLNTFLSLISFYIFFLFLLCFRESYKLAHDVSYGACSSSGCSLTMYSSHFHIFSQWEQWLTLVGSGKHIRVVGLIFIMCEWFCVKMLAKLFGSGRKMFGSSQIFLYLLSKKWLSEYFLSTFWSLIVRWMLMHIRWESYRVLSILILVSWEKRQE